MQCFAKDIEKHVLHGGRNPCLLPDEPASAPNKHLSELELEHWSSIGLRILEA